MSEPSVLFRKGDPTNHRLVITTRTNRGVNGKSFKAVFTVCPPGKYAWEESCEWDNSTPTKRALDLLVKKTESSLSAHVRQKTSLLKQWVAEIQAEAQLT